MADRGRGEGKGPLGADWVQKNNGGSMSKRRALVVEKSPDLDPFPDAVVEDNEGKGVGRWIPERKHYYLSKYIDAARAAARRWGGWVFLDPFCGPGRIRVLGESSTRDGGCVIAWKQSLASGTPFSKVLIGDKDSERVEACAARLKSSEAPVETFSGPAIDTVSAMVERVPRGSLCLAYIDPYNLKFLDFEIMRTLAQLNIDFVVNFFASDARRNIDEALDPDDGRFDDVSPGWRKRVPMNLNKANLALAFFADWYEQIKGLGFEFSNAMPMIQNSKNTELYKLVFFARHDLPIRLWGDVAGNPNGELFL
jgi:three-Cys-motif partner protein